MNYEQYHKYSQQSCKPRTFGCVAEEHQRHQTRTGMKRLRDYSPPGSDCANDTSYSHQITKRLRRSSLKSFPGSTHYNPNHNNNHNGIFLASKSDDEISLAEEAQTTPTSLPQHSSFIQRKQNESCHHFPQIHQQQQRMQRVVSNVAPTNVPSENRISGTNLKTHATDYQPMNSFLGNLHLMRQQQQLKRQEILQQQQQQQTQSHYGTYHLVPTRPLNTKKRSQKKTVSLRVNSNLY